MTKFRSLFYPFIFILTLSVSAQNVQHGEYKFSVDLNKVKNDKLEVSLTTPNMGGKSAVYHIPKIVPGTYAIYDFGRYISDFKAFDKKGKELKVSKSDENSWEIKDASKLHRITYLVEDTWDSPEIKGEHIFEPAGTNFDDKKIFALNTFGLFGYFEGLKNLPYEVNFTKPKGFYGSTSLLATKTSASNDIYTTKNYMDLADAPIMYNLPDTTVLKIGDSDVLVAVYSPNKKANSKEIAEDIKATLNAQKEYLGGSLPIKRYAFIIYLSDDPNISSYGALEHSYSSFYYLPEASSKELSQTVKDVASHEFFHILTPLNIHSYEIGDFDYIKPKMSRHLWMYEGLTEYAAHHMQLKYGLIDFKTYLDRQRLKMDHAETFQDNLPFTEMSENVLDKYKKEYNNVYEKGALIGLCLDIKLRKLSGGKYGTQNMMSDLAKTYGKDKSFNDNELFDKIVSLTFPEIKDFFAKYVSGKEPLPLEETFASIGVKYEKGKKIMKPTMGKISFNYNAETQRIFVADVSQMNEFGTKMGFQKGDEIVSINAQPFGAATYQEVMDNYNKTIKEGDNVEVVIMRKNADGKYEEKKLKSKAIVVEARDKNSLVEIEKPTAEQLALRKAWLSIEK